MRSQKSPHSAGINSGGQDGRARAADRRVGTKAEGRRACGRSCGSGSHQFVAHPCEGARRDRQHQFHAEGGTGSSMSGSSRISSSLPSANRARPSSTAFGSSTFRTKSAFDGSPTWWGRRSNRTIRAGLAVRVPGLSIHSGTSQSLPWCSMASHRMSADSVESSTFKSLGINVFYWGLGWTS